MIYLLDVNALLALGLFSMFCWKRRSSTSDTIPYFLLITSPGSAVLTDTNLPC
jgi:hypothetical protein